jgi:two-component system response regulator PilR (NtrC family)
VALETSSIVLPESLTLSEFRKGPIPENRRRTDLTSNGVELDKVMADIERDYILKAMEMARGSKQKAAQLLGLSMRSLRYRLDKLGLHGSSD